MTTILELLPERKIRIWPEISELPIEIELPRRRRFAVVLMAVICVIASGLFGMYMLFTPLILAGSKLGIWISFIVTLAVLVLGWRAMRQYVLRDRLTIGPSGVDVVFRTLGRDRRLHWPMDACRGLRRREVRLKNREGSEIRYTLIEIVHATGESAPVIVERGIFGLTDELYELSDRLGLAIISD